MRKLFILIFLFSFSSLNFAQSLDQAIAQSRQLEASGSYQELYALLLPLESDFSGDPEFDFYLGLAALENNRAAEAVFALERALDIRPDFARARAELGRAYFMLGENDNAKAEFENVKADTNTPEGVVTTLDKFLAAIDNRFDSSGQRLEFFVDTTVGNDSNINAGTDATETSIFFGGIELSGFVVSEDSQATDSTFTTIRPGLRFSTPINENLNFYANADFTQQSVSDADQFSSDSHNISASIAKLAGANRYQGSLAIQSYEVSEQEFARDSTTLSGQWIKTVDNKTKYNAYISLADVAYDDGIKDGSINSIGFNWLKSVGRYANYIGIYLGDESIDDDGQQQQAKDYTGIKLGTRANVSNKAVFANFVYQDNQFKDVDNTQGGVKRDGTFTSINLGVDIPYNRKLVFTPQLSYLENSTKNNLALFEYDRTIFSVLASYQF